MTRLEEARKRRMEKMEFFATNEKLKEQILDVIIEVLEHKTKVVKFDPIKIIFHRRSCMKNEDILIGYCLIHYHTYEYEDNQVVLEETLPYNLQWYAKVIHKFLSEQKELEVTELCQSEEEDCASFTVNFSIK